MATAMAWIGASGALADSTISSNWSGYAAHRRGIRFRAVGATWRVPTARCAPGSSGYTAIWVGLGGYARGANGLEQTGVEVDCSTSGRASYSAWYELIPAPVNRIPLHVQPGDLIRAQVSVRGTRALILLADQTSHRSFKHVFHPTRIDTSSAEWIVEAPSDCDATRACQALPLADFGTASFSSAAAGTASHSGAVAAHWWTTTGISLLPGGDRYFAGNRQAASGEAVPSWLSQGGSEFTVTYHAAPAGAVPVAGSGSSFVTRRPAARAS